MSTDPKISVRRTGRDRFMAFVDQGVGQTIETLVVNVDGRTLKNFKRFQCAGLVQCTRIVFREEWKAIVAEALNAS